MAHKALILALRKIRTDKSVEAHREAVFRYPDADRRGRVSGKDDRRQLAHNAIIGYLNLEHSSI
jgi:hypothetical protein